DGSTWVAGMVVCACSFPTVEAFTSKPRARARRYAFVLIIRFAFHSSCCTGPRQPTIETENVTPGQVSATVKKAASKKCPTPLNSSDVDERVKANHSGKV